MNLNFYLGELEMTRLELIAQICKRMTEDLKESNDKAEERDRLDNSDLQDLCFEPHQVKLNREE